MGRPDNRTNAESNFKSGMVGRCALRLAGRGAQRECAWGLVGIGHGGDAGDSGDTGNGIFCSKISCSQISVGSKIQRPFLGCA